MIINHLLHLINKHTVVEIKEDVIIKTSQQFLDIIMNLPTDRIVLYKKNLDESFFDLRSGLADDILQKVVNYNKRLAIVGDFSNYESKSLRDFIYESNKAHHVAFLSSIDEAIQRLGA